MEAKDKNNANSAFLTVKADMDCKLYCDGDFVDCFEAGKTNKVRIPTGRHIIDIESEHVEGLSKFEIIDAADSAKNHLLLVDDMKQQEQKALALKAGIANAYIGIKYSSRILTISKAALMDFYRIPTEFKFAFPEGIPNVYSEAEQFAYCMSNGLSVKVLDNIETVPHKDGKLIPGANGSKSYVEYTLTFGSLLAGLENALNHEVDSLGDNGYYGNLCICCVFNIDYVRDTLYPDCTDEDLKEHKDELMQIILYGESIWGC